MTVLFYLSELYTQLSTATGHLEGDGLSGESFVNQPFTLRYGEPGKVRGQGLNCVAY